MELARRLERISIHAPPRGATQTRFFLRCACKSFQFTPLREGRQCFFQLPTFARLISIHAPPRGATKMEGSKLYIVAISIHAPPRGATRSWRAYRDDANYFNSRPSARGDALLSAGFCKSLYFNSRPSARGDAYFFRQNSTNAYFNSRPSARGDNIVHTPLYADFISIHAPPRGATCTLRMQS